MMFEEKDLQKFYENITPLRCPICKGEKFICPGEPAKISIHGGYAYFAPVVCKECGYTYFFNANFAGLLDESKKGSDDK